MATPPALTAVERRRKNVRTGIILATVAAAFFVGFVIKMMWLGQSR